MPIYDDHFAFCGLYIVDPAYRGRGYGLALTKASLDYIGDRNAGLDGVEVMADKYRRLGYRTAHRSTRHVFRPQTEQTVETEIVPLANVPFAELAAYDRCHFFAPREAFLRRWIDQSGGAALGFVDAGRLKGYGVLRKCRVGYKIGPLFADRADIAEHIARSLMARMPGEQVQIDLPEANLAAVALAERFGFKMSFGCMRLYHGSPPALPIGRTFAVTSLEFGWFVDAGEQASRRLGL